VDRHEVIALYLVYVSHCSNLYSCDMRKVYLHLLLVSIAGRINSRPSQRRHKLEYRIKHDHFVKRLDRKTAVPDRWVMINALTRPEHVGQDLSCFYQACESGGIRVSFADLESGRSGGRDPSMVILLFRGPVSRCTQMANLLGSLKPMTSS
jgi:hypothetical protein